jgi:hypothetical protein
VVARIACGGYSDWPFQPAASTRGSWARCRRHQARGPRCFSGSARHCIAHSLNGGGDRRGARLRLDGCPARASLLSCPGHRGIFLNARPLPAHGLETARGERRGLRPDEACTLGAGENQGYKYVRSPHRLRHVRTYAAARRRAEVYLSGGERRSVCELCKSRAVNEGWAREGTVPEYEEVPRSPDRRRLFLHRLRLRRDSGSRELATTSSVGDVNESVTSRPPTRGQETT